MYPGSCTRIVQVAFPTWLMFGESQSDRSKGRSPLVQQGPQASNGGFRMLLRKGHEFANGSTSQLLPHGTKATSRDVE